MNLKILNEQNSMKLANKNILLYLPSETYSSFLLFYKYSIIIWHAIIKNKSNFYKLNIL